MRRAFFLVLVFLTACGRSEPVRTDVNASQTRPPQFSDADPVEFGSQSPRNFRVHGVDLSKYQATIDWNAAKRAGVNFAWIKATEGGDLLDVAFAANHDNAARAGVAVGAYHFFYWCRPAAEQARWFIRNVPKRAGDLPPVLDLEWTPFSPTCTRRPPQGEVIREAQIFLDILERHYGQRPLVYATKEIWDDRDLRPLRAEFWLRSTAKPVREVYDRTPWRIWQYSATGRVPGIAGDVDLNAFNGSPADWQSWYGRRAIR
ncbi:GH25 family lysozyme [Palleronia caenipelagi]|uniref:Glycoside hydrolase n=1 Tax=Palleronia caenipelagi TaxID=2489174 RepID=A0A547QB28_9RHOB|nr:GH25 family lysozyme [Palleronia caenipelagi]TRD23582.1 glycoside hydrolase [Palleronia caenipelagi]